MEKKRSPKGLEAFFAGKGFYIVLSLCAVIIGVTAWTMFARAKANEETPIDTEWQDLDAYRAAEYTPVAPFEAVPPDITGSAPESAPETESTDAGIAGGSEAASVGLQTQETAPVWNPDDPGITTQQNFYWPVNGDIETPYSADALLYNRTLSDWRTHEGVDIAAELGAQVMAAGSGRVESIYTDDLFGVTVVIDHMGGLKSVYSNLADTPTVYVGDGVIAGEIIGAVGTSALAETNEATHLHFAMTLDGQSIDPAEYMP